MNTPATEIAGAITVALHTSAGRVAAARIRSTRPTDFARRLLGGRVPDEVLAAVPRVFSICATAQASAAVQALEAAAAVTPAPQQVAARELLVLVETAREHLFRILLGWSDWLGLAPPAAGLGALGRMRQAWVAALYPEGDAFRPGGGRLAPDRRALDGLADELEGLLDSALGGTADWCALSAPADLYAWARTGDRVAPRLLAAVLDEGLAGLGVSPVAALPSLDPTTLAGQLAGPAAAAFVAAPMWAGRACETSALTRRAGEPLITALTGAHGNGVLARLAARLSELVAVVAGVRRAVDRLEPAGPGEDPPASANGDGVAQVEAARGRLAHWVRLVDGRVGDYRILAPTEWNFHPQGPLALGLLGLPADERLRRYARLLVDAIDPCVESRIEVVADA